MIRITRTVLPETLASRLAQLTLEIDGLPVDGRTSHARALWKAGGVRRNVHVPLTEILRGMAPGREHCMYCGDNQGTDVDHHEPLARNPRRTFDWLNHLLACSSCNSHHKRDRFPLDDAGRPLLIDPTSEDPFEHLLLALSLGEYHPMTPKGQATIEVCGLNRPLLVRGRVQARRVVELCLAHWRKAHDDGDTGEEWMATLTVREQPFADVCQSMLRQAQAPGAQAVFADRPDVLECLRTPELRAALLS